MGELEEKAAVAQEGCAVAETDGADACPAPEDAAQACGCPDGRESNPDAEGVGEMPARTFTQEEVNGLIGKARAESRERTFRYVYDRYGVSGEGELDDLVGNSQRFESLREEYDESSRAAKAAADEAGREIARAREELALLRSGIDKSRFDDARLIIGGKGMEVTDEAIAAELASHPEWRQSPDAAGAGQPFHRSPEAANAAPSTMAVMGNEPAARGGEAMSEEDYAMGRLFKI